MSRSKIRKSGKEVFKINDQVIFSYLNGVDRSTKRISVLSWILMEVINDLNKSTFCKLKKRILISVDL